MKTFCALAFALALLSYAQAAQDQNSGERQRDERNGVAWFSIFTPQAFQKNPRLQFNVITEMTEAGRKIDPPTEKKPAFYVAHPKGYIRLGQGAPARESTPPPELLLSAMKEALSVNHYLEAPTDAQPCDIAIVFYWGSHSTAGWDAEAMAGEMNAAAANPEAPPPPVANAESAATLLPLVLSDLAKRRELLERASLVGGVKFAAELQRVLNEEVDFEEVRQTESRLAEFMNSTGTGRPGGVTALGGAVAGEMSAAFKNFNPFHRFKTRDARTEYLVEQSFRSFYFVVASAYDYASLASDERVLLWRTKMTVDSNGVAMVETLPRLIANAGPHFGKDMDAAVTLRQRIDREGSVEIGTPTVVEVIETAEPAPAPAETVTPAEATPAR